MNTCECVCVLVSFYRINPTTSLISSYPPHPPVPTSGFFFNEMFGPYTVLTLYLSSFILSLFSNLSPVFPSFIVFGFLSVVKVIKGQHIEGALLGFVILFCCTLLFVFYFCLWQQTLSGRWA